MALDGDGKIYDIEVQRADKGAEPHRARYHSSMMDIENLDAGQDFSELPDTYVIFITELDYFKKGEPVYVIQNMNLTTGKLFEDGAHIIYVNGEYRGDSDIGKLMHDFNCTDADDMNFKLLSDKTRYLKENPKGVSEMCKVMEELRDESYAEGRIEQAKITAHNLYIAGMSIEKIASAVNYSVDEVRTWIEKKDK